jgi:hypothetical protein
MTTQKFITMTKTFSLIISLLLICNLHASEKITAITATKTKVEKEVERIKSNFEKFNINGAEVLKSAPSSKTKLQTIDGDWGRKEFEYDANDQITDYKYFSVDMYSGNEALAEHQVFEYNTSGQLILFELFSNDMYGGWVLLEKEEYEYYSNGDIKKVVYSEYIDGEGTTPVYKTEFEYNGNSNTEYSFIWDADSEEWIDEGYMIYQTNAQGQVLEAESYEYDEDLGEIALWAVMVFEYNSQGLPTSVLVKLSDEGELVDFMRSETEYNSSGQPVLDQTIMYSGEDEMIMDKEVYIYESGRLIKEESYALNFMTMEASLSYYTEYEYQQGKLISESEYQHDPLEDGFVLNRKILFTFGDNINPDNLVIPAVAEYESFYSDDIYDMDYYVDGLLTEVEEFARDWDSGNLVSVKSSQYTYSGSSVSLSSDAKLESLNVNANPLEGFDPEVFNYNVVLAAEVSELPVVSAGASHANASVSIEQVEGIPGTATVTVTAEDGETVYTYQINFTREAALSNDASLSEILLDGVLISGFSSSVYEYEIELPAGTSDIPQVVVAVSDENANADISQASALPGDAVIVVTAEDGETQIIYTISFTVASSVGDVLNAGISVYPNPASDIIYVDLGAKFDVESILIYNGKGQNYNVAKHLGFAGEIQIDVTNIREGINFIEIVFVNGNKRVVRFIKM